MRRVVWFIFFLVIAISCLDEPDCYNQNQNMLGISFRKMFDGKGDTVVIWKAYADGFDTVFYDTVAVTSLSLPLNYLTNATSFTIEGMEKVYQLMLSHQSKTQFVSEDCGSKFFVTNLEINGYSFDSVRLVSNSTSNPPHVNIEVYRCPRTNIMRFSFRQLYMDTISHGKLVARQVNTVTANYIPVPLYEDADLMSILLPLNSGANSATFNFNLDDNEQKTFTVNYHIDEKEIFKRCGTQKLFSQLDTVDNDFPLLKISADSIHDPPYTNLESYKCPITNEIRTLFKQRAGSSKITDTLNLITVTADFLSDPIYTNVATTSVILPLNPNANVATYTFSQVGGVTNKLQVTYATKVTNFHKMCGPQTVFTALEVIESDFGPLEDTEITDDQAKFPVTNNIEVLR